MRKLALGIGLILCAGVAGAETAAIRCGQLLDVRTGQMRSHNLPRATCLPGLIDIQEGCFADPVGRSIL